MSRCIPVFAVALASLTPAVSAPAANEARPNVLFVVSDDLNCRIACFGDPVAKTPNIDRLASMGVRFDRAYCQFPLCNPTRSSVLSGRYPTTTGVLDNDTLLMVGGDVEILPDCFQRQGYAVATHGKIWHGPNRGSKPGDPKPITKKQQVSPWFTPDERARQQAGEPGYWDEHHSPYRNLTLKDPAQYAWANEFGPLPAGDPGPDAPIADKAIASLQTFKAAGQPFFLAVGFLKPHVPLKAPKQFFDLYDPTKMPLPPDFATEPTGPDGTPPDEIRKNLDLFCARPFTEAEAREAIRAYYACVTYMDTQLGRVLDELDRLGLRENTILLLWGDHGWHLSEKGMWAKGTTFDVAARGPLIIADPRKETAGKSSSRVVQYLDMYPTLTELCGIQSLKGLQGHSLVPLLENPEAPWQHPAFTVQTRGWFIGRSVRTERWRYTEWDEGRRGAMLFDHENDPYEMRNLTGDPGSAKTVAQMKALLQASPIAPGK